MGGIVTFEGNGPLVTFVRFVWFAASVTFDGGSAEVPCGVIYTNLLVIFLSHPVRRGYHLLHAVDWGSL